MGTGRQVSVRVCVAMTLTNVWGWDELPGHGGPVGSEGHGVGLVGQE